MTLVRACVFGVVAGCLFVFSATAQSLKPSKVIDLAHVTIAGTDCKASLPTGFSSIHWVDDSRMLASTYWAQCGDATSSDLKKKYETEVVLFDVRGATLATAHSHASMYTNGPHGTVAALQDGAINLLDGTLQNVQTIPCPLNVKTCGISLDRSSAVNAEFAVCSASDQMHRVCDFYTGLPAKKVREESFAAGIDPFTRAAVGIWQVSQGENWLFKGGHLTRVGADGRNSLVSPTDFVGNQGGGCGGELSEALPKRFLATCVGTHWYSDGMFDSIFGFSHAVLFDVSTGNIIGQVDGGAFIRSALSPSGREIAILKGKKVRLYDAR